jgi:hypothetical protein
MTRTTVLAGLFALAGCSAADVTTSVEPLVNEVSFSPGCGAKTDAPDCSFGFVMAYASYPDVETAISHVTDNTEHTVEITVDAWSSSHTATEVLPRDAELGLLDAKVGQTYKVTVVDRKHAVLWSGKVDTVYHL